MLSVLRNASFSSKLLEVVISLSRDRCGLYRDFSSFNETVSCCITIRLLCRVAQRGWNNGMCFGKYHSWPGTQYRLSCTVYNVKTRSNVPNCTISETVTCYFRTRGTRLRKPCDGCCFFFFFIFTPVVRTSHVCPYCSHIRYIIYVRDVHMMRVW